MFQENGQSWVTSLDVAKDFEKEHFHVLEAIKNLECSQEFRETNFRLSEYFSKQNKKQPMYKMTRDGFTFLAMGFTGPKAISAKLHCATSFEHSKK